MSQCQGCSFQFMRANLSSDFGISLLKRKFPDSYASILNEVGIYTKGKYAGQYKGAICWIKCTTGGWDYEFKSGVMKRGSFAYKVIADAWDPASSVIGYDDHPLHQNVNFSILSGF